MWIRASPENFTFIVEDASCPFSVVGLEETPCRESLMVPLDQAHSVVARVGGTKVLSTASILSPVVAWQALGMFC